MLLDAWSAADAVALAADEHVTMLVGVPVMLQGMLNSPAYTRESLRSVRLFAVGGDTA